MSDLTNWYMMQEETAPVNPVCEECEEPIDDDFGYHFSGYWICEDCASRAHVLINRGVI